MALAAAPWAAAAAATADLQLRTADTLDAKRIGRASDDERAVLRVEWRAAQSGVDEAHAVDEMLGSLRRMEGTVAELGRLIRNVPARPAAVAAVAADQAEAESFDVRWALAAAATAAAVLLAFWWSRRRDSAQPPAARPDAMPATRPVVESSPAAILAEPLPAAIVEPAPASTPPMFVEHLAELPAAPAKPELAAQPPSEQPLHEDFAATVIIKPQPEHVPTPEAQPAALALAANDEAPATAAAAETPPIEFSLEDEDPEAVARANARIPVPRTRSGQPHVPERRKDRNVEPTLELAEIMMSMGLQQSAAQALLEYSENNPRQALYHWLKLLDIYRNAGHQDDFKETAEKLRQHFNIHADDWGVEGSGDEPALENFSRVAQHVQTIWSRADECMAYLQHLLEDNREGSRAGFPRPVAEEIMLLIEILKETSGANQAAAA